MFIKEKIIQDTAATTKLPKACPSLTTKGKKSAGSFPVAMCVLFKCFAKKCWFINDLALFH